MIWIKRQLIYYNPKEKNAKIANDELSRILQEKSIDFASAEASSEEEISQAIAKLVSEKIEFAYIPSDSFLISKSEMITSPLKKSKIPSYGAVKKLVENGAMIGIVCDYYVVGRELAKKAQDLLNGKSAADIPSNRLPLSMQTILVNAETVEAVGASIPYEILSVAKIEE